jgi:hypothetical protein
MAEKYTRQDLDYVYRTILGYDDRAAKDLPKILSQMPADGFTLADLQKLNRKGNKINDKAFNDALAFMTSAEQEAPAAPAQGSGPPPANATAGRSMAPGGGAQPPPAININDYTPGLGQTGDALTRLFAGQGGQGQQAAPWQQGPFRAPPTFSEGYAQGALNNLQRTPPTAAEQYALQALGNFRPTPPSGLENMLGAAVSRGPQGLTPGPSSFENMLQAMAQNPYLMSLARGEIPPVMQAALDNQMKLGRAGTLEQLGAGQGTVSSDLAQYMQRTEDEARTNFLANMAAQAGANQNILGGLAGAGGGLANQRMGIGANLFPGLLGTGISAEQGRRGTDLQQQLSFLNPLFGAEQNRQGLDLQREMGYLNPLFGLQSGANENALNRYLGLGSTLFGGEENQRNQGQQLMYQDYLRSQGLPPELAALLSLAGLGGGTTKSTGSSTSSTSGGMGLDLLGALGNLGGTAITGGMFGFGPLSGMLGGKP